MGDRQGWEVAGWGIGGGSQYAEFCSPAGRAAWNFSALCCQAKQEVKNSLDF